MEEKKNYNKEGNARLGSTKKSQGGCVGCITDMAYLILEKIISAGASI